MRRLLLLLIILVLMPVMAYGQYPDVVPGKFVYTIPENFDPPMIGRSGIKEIQAAAKNLRYPYYVVLVERLNGSEDEDAANFIDDLAMNWQRDPDFNSAESSIFLLSYSPRKYRFLAGSRWENELGFRPPQHAQFNTIFESYVQRSRKDPKTGIIKMMQAVDRHLVVESDPKTIAARKEAERKAEIERQKALEQARKEAELGNAKGQLGGEIGLLSQLLASDPRFLPKDVSSYVSARDSAALIIQESDKDKIIDETAKVRQKRIELGTYITTRRNEAQAKAMRTLGQMGAAVFIVIFASILGLVRGRKYSRLKHDFDRKIKAWDERITNAQPKYLNFEKERQMVAGLRELSGRTKELYESTTHEVDSIFIAIGAMRTHIEKSKVTAQKGSFFNIKPLERALANLDSEFTVDTEQLNKMDLFAPETKQVNIRPSQVAEELEDRFARAIKQWDHLKKAAEVRYHQSEEVFTQAKLDDILKTADEQGIPHRWFADHPLYGDEQSDKTLYTNINDNRWNDPVAYLERIEELQAKEAEIVERLERLVKAIAVTKSQRVDSVPDFTAVTVLQPQDDPQVTFNSARREEAKFMGMLASRDNVEEIEKQAAAVQELYRQCVEQSVMVQTAISQAETDVEQTRAMIPEVSALLEGARQQVEERRPIFSNISGPEASLNDGERFLEAGKTAIESASALIRNRRHLEAQNDVMQARKHLETAKRELTECLTECQYLDETRRAFEAKWADMDHERMEAESRIRRYGGKTGSLRNMNRPRLDGAVDYLLLMTQLEALESSWEREVRKARDLYEEEERIRRRQSEDSSWGSSWGSSSSSSSGSSWTGSSDSSSSSGGSWGGSSDSSSSSSSSSSGGDW